MRRAAVAVLLFSFGVWAEQKPVETLIITNVNVVDVRGGGIAPNLTVIIKGKKIEAIAKIAVLESGPHVQVVNGGGKYLIPALWDMNARLSSSAAPKWDRQSLYALYLTAGVQGMREPQGDKEMVEQVSDLLDPQKDLSAQTRLAVFPLDGVHELGKCHSIENIEDVMVACSSNEQAFRGRQPEPPQDDLDYAADPRKPLQQEVRETYDSKKAYDLFVKISEHGIWMVPSLVSYEAPIALLTKEDWEDIADPTSIKRPQWQIRTIFEQKAELNRAMMLTHDMRVAGVQFLAGSGGPAENVVPGRSLHRELELLVKSGFSPLDALRSATINPALYLAKLDQYGVVEPAHVADLILLNENPLQDISNVEKIDAVIAKGKYFSRTDLDALAATVKSGQAATASKAPVRSNKAVQ